MLSTDTAALCVFTCLLLGHMMSFREPAVSCGSRCVGRHTPRGAAWGSAGIPDGLATQWASLLCQTQGPARLRTGVMGGLYQSPHLCQYPTMMGFSLLLLRRARHGVLLQLCGVGFQVRWSPFTLSRPRPRLSSGSPQGSCKPRPRGGLCAEGEEGPGVPGSLALAGWLSSPGTGQRQSCHLRVSVW